MKFHKDKEKGRGDNGKKEMSPVFQKTDIAQTGHYQPMRTKLKLSKGNAKERCQSLLEPSARLSNEKWPHGSPARCRQPACPALNMRTCLPPQCRRREILPLEKLKEGLQVPGVQVGRAGVNVRMVQW